jgi:cytochrome c553
MIHSVVATLWGVILASTLAAPSNPEQTTAMAPLGVPDPQHGMILFLKHCAACHGRSGWGDEPREIPVLAGQHETYLLQQLTQFAGAARQGSEMHGPVMHEILQLPDINRTQALRDLASYLEAAPRNPQPDYGNGHALALGNRDYSRTCAGCHGSDGSGSKPGLIPAIGGQGYSYLLTQLRSFASARLDHPPLSDPSVLRSSEEQQAVADYVSRLDYLTASRGTGARAE